MDSKKVNNKKGKNAKFTEGSKQRVRLFYAITISVPFLFFILLELGLRAGNYMGNLELFSDPGIESEAYLLPNPNFAARYFFYTKTVPSPSHRRFQTGKERQQLPSVCHGWILRRGLSLRVQWNLFTSNQRHITGLYAGS